MEQIDKMCSLSTCFGIQTHISSACDAFFFTKVAIDNFSLVTVRF